MQKVQIKFNKKDTDTFINELRDSIVGYALGFELINVEKHGFDCKTKDNMSSKYLEVKNASFSSKQWQATFNDTTYEKAEAFKDEKLFLALAVWKEASDLLFICYGQDERIGDFLKSKIHVFKSGEVVRSTQSISLRNLVFDYNFRILTISKSRDDVYEYIVYKNKAFREYNKDEILELKDFKGV